MPRTIVRTTRTRTRLFGSIARLYDSDFDEDRNKDLVYEFSGDRKFYENPIVSGLYGPASASASFDTSFDSSFS